MKVFNDLAAAAELDGIPTRPSTEQITQLWSSLWASVPVERRDQLRAAKDLWLQNHGEGAFPEGPMMGGEAAADAEGGQVASEIVDNHRVLPQTFYPGVAAKKAFRLKSKAFLLTFNSLRFAASSTLWEEFVGWVKARVQEFHASHWSAAMERSLHSATAGRVHLHVYFSWQKPGSKGVDHATTDSWVFQSVRPRVDVNSEVRGPYHWLKATQRGHFYCSVRKEGAVYTGTDRLPALAGGLGP